jgi:hypothetical protein
MRRRRVLAVVAVAVLALTAGCAGVFGGGIPDEQLDETPSEPYDWNTTRDVTITVLGGSYQAVYDLNNTTRLELFQRGLGNDNPLSIRSVRYRYPNGTQVNGSAPAVEVSQEGSNTVVELPNGSGMLAYTADAGGKEFGTPSFVDGSYEVVLPPGHRVSSFLFGGVDPGGFETSVDDRDRLRITWEEVTGDVYVRFYLVRDVLIFRGLLVALVVVAAGGVLYYYRQIRKLEEKREEMGLDVDTDADDDFGGGPPPGMR